MRTHEAAVAQQAELVRDGRLRDVRNHLELGDALVTQRERAKQLEAREVGQGVKDLRRPIDDVIVCEKVGKLPALLDVHALVLVCHARLL